MKPPFHSKGLRYFTSHAGERQCSGSLMGRADSLPRDRSESVRLLLVRVNPCGCGDYDKGGAYWGALGSRPLYCAFGETGWLYVRAANRTAARSAVLASWPGAIIRR